MTTAERKRLDSVIGYGTSSTVGTRDFPVIDGIVYTDLFTDSTVTIDGFEVTGVRFNGEQGSAYNNEIRVTEQRCLDETLVTVTATWGNAAFDTDAQELLDYISTNGTGEAGVRSKKIEDFSVTVASGRETIHDFWAYVNLNWGFLIRQLLLVDVAPSRTEDDYLAF